METLTADDVANEISMSRSVFGGAYLVVEGATDLRLYGKFLDGGAKAIAAHSRNNVRNAVGICRRRKDRAVVGIVDRDMDDLLGRHSDPPVFRTDGRDMECMLLRSAALDQVLAEYGDPEKMRRFSRMPDGIRGTVARAAAPLGALMYISYRNGLGLSFKNLDHSRFVDARLETDITAMVDEVYSGSAVRAFPARTLQNMVSDMVGNADDIWKMVRGHDAVAVLAIGIRKVFGQYNGGSLRDDALQGALRIAYGREDFTATELYRASSAYAAETGIALWAVGPARRSPYVSPRRRSS